MAEVMIFDQVNRFIWSSAIFVLIFAGLLFLYRGYKQVKSDERILMFGFAGLFIGIAISQIFFYFSHFLIIGFYSDHVYYGDLSNVIPPYDILTKGGYVSGTFGITIFFLAFERIQNRTKYILTIYTIIVIVIVIIFPFSIARLLNYIFVSGSLIILFLILLWLSRKSTKETQIVSIFLMAGFCMMEFGFALDSVGIKSLNIIHPTLPIIISMIGVLICISPTLINPKYFLRSTIIWSIFIIFNAILLLICLFFVVFYPMFITILLIGIAGIFIIVISIIYSVNQIIHIRTPTLIYSREIKEKEEVRDLLKVFSKPQRVTEEEVSISKEKQVCLVCKGKISGLNFICPECGTFYCTKCSKALSNLENICWACNSPIDPSKPMKLYEKDEEEVIAEEVILKKGKEKQESLKKS